MPGSAQKTGIANLPLHYGKVPPWLFGRMSQFPSPFMFKWC